VLYDINKVSYKSTSQGGIGMYALILEGGGAKGAYHIGAYKAIKEMNINISMIAGTSIGAINGAILAQGDYKLAEKLWCEVDMEQLFNLELKPKDFFSKKGFNDYSFRQAYELLGQIIGNGGINTDPIKKLLNEYIDEKKLRKASIDYALVTVNIDEYKALELHLDDIPNGKLVDYIMASASFPAFKSEMIDGKKFIDGGIYNNLPINLALEKNYSNIIAVRTFGVGRNRKFNTKDADIITIEPKESLGKTLDFNTQTAKYNIKLGYYDSMRVLKKLYGRYYYINNIKNEHYYINYLANIDESIIKKIAKKMNVKAYSDKRYLFENLIPKLANLMGLPKDATYQDIVIGLYEELAKALNLERFKIYHYDGFLFEIYRNYKRKESNKKVVPSMYMQNDLLAILKKQEIILEIAEILLIN
jgi:NTE family protein